MCQQRKSCTIYIRLLWCIYSHPRMICSPTNCNLLGTARGCPLCMMPILPHKANYYWSCDLAPTYANYWSCYSSSSTLLCSHTMMPILPHKANYWSCHSTNQVPCSARTRGDTEAETVHSDATKRLLKVSVNAFYILSCLLCTLGLLRFSASLLKARQLVCLSS